VLLDAERKVAVTIKTLLRQFVVDGTKSLFEKIFRFFLPKSYETSDGFSLSNAEVTYGLFGFSLAGLLIR